MVYRNAEIWEQLMLYLRVIGRHPDGGQGMERKQWTNLVDSWCFISVQAMKK